MSRQRAQLAKAPQNYFTSEKANIQFVPSGCVLLDCALGGGWALGRVANIVGDKSTAKTGLAIEALINFTRSYPKGRAAYCESEAAFDELYAKAMGLPLEKIDFRGKKTPILTVEQFAKDFEKYLDACIKDNVPGIYVLDSLDALSDDAEMDRELGKATYGMAKPKLLSEFFRTRIHKIESSKVLLLIVSQVRDNIGAMFGEKHKRSGGKALDFYCSQVLWLSKIKTLKRTIKKAQRAYGVVVKASVKKNKVGLPFREAEFEFIFGYGAEDLGASIDWLAGLGRLADAELTQKYLDDFAKLSDEDYRKDQDRITQVVKLIWAEIETSFLPTRSKYG